MNSREILLYLSILYEGDWNQIYEAILNKMKINEKDVPKITKKNKTNFITILDDNYPSLLKQVPKPPFVLYYKGDISLLNNTKKTIAVVGSRDLSTYGQYATESIVKEISKELIVVSGLARGIDSLAHQVTLENNGKTIAVLGCGIERCYPTSSYPLYREICEKGLVISEYPNKTEPSQDKFPSRNRIVGYLANCVLIPEAKVRSGTSITAELMLQHGGEVCCVPTRINEDSLCNYLIGSGASLVETATDIFEVMGYRPNEPIFKSEK